MNNRERIIALRWVVAQFNILGINGGVVTGQRQAVQLAALITQKFGFTIQPWTLMNRTLMEIVNLINPSGGKG